MDDVLTRFGQALDVPQLTEDEIDALLELARIIAHGSERRFAPLSPFIAGRATANGKSVRDALAAARAITGDVS